MLDTQRLNLAGWLSVTKVVLSIPILVLPLVLFVLVSALLVGCQQTRSTGGVTRSSAVPDFVQVGKSYEFWTGMAAARVRVLEIRPDGWVRGEYAGKVVWFNVNQLLAIKEIEE
jgi:hypothetical protein